MTAETPNVPAIRQQGTALDAARPGSGLVSKVAGEATKFLPSRTKKMHRLGDYGVDEQSYQQIMVWLDQLEHGWFSPYVRRSKHKDGLVTIGHMRPDLGAIFSEEASRRLRSRTLDHFLSLQEFRFRIDDKPVGGKGNFVDQYGQLLSVYLEDVDLPEIDLSKCPSLRELHVVNGFLEELSLVSVPKLQTLFCDYNEISTLDLSHVPKLTELHCNGNALTELDITACETLNFTLSCDPYVVIHKRSDQSVNRIP